jgi:hypothetical protein
MAIFRFPNMKTLLLAWACLALCLAQTASSAADTPPAETDTLTASLALSAGFERYRNPSIFIDDADVIQAAQGNASRDSPYLEALLGLDLDVPLKNDRAWVGSLDLEVRRSADLPELHRDRLRLFTGPSLPLGNTEAEMLLVVDELSLGMGDFRRHGVGVRANQQMRLEGSRGKATLEWMRYRHEGLDDVYDADRIGLRYSHEWNLSGTWRSSLRLRAGLGSDVNRRGFDDLSSRELLLEAEASIMPRASWTLSAFLGGRLTRYREPAPGLDFTRHDRRAALLLAAQYQVGKGRIQRCEIEVIRRDSNDPVAEAELSRLGCGVEWTF